MELPPALAARFSAREAARKEAVASLRQERSDGADSDLSSDIATWRAAVSSLELEAREAAVAPQKENKNVAVDNSGADDVDKKQKTSSSSLLDSLGARLSQLELQAASLSTRIKGSRMTTTREGESLLQAASRAREALRAARAAAAPAFRLADSTAAATGGEAEAEEPGEEAEKNKKLLEEAATEENASAVADAASGAARLSGLKRKTLLLTQASFSSPSLSSSSSPPPSSLHLPSLRLEDLEDCVVAVSVPLGSVVMKGLTRCVVFLAAPVGGGGSRSESGGSDGSGSGEGGGGGGAVLVDGASASRLFVAAHQVRLHRMTGGCDVYVRSAAPPVVEACSGLRVAPYPARAAEKAGEETTTAETETTTTETTTTEATTTSTTKISSSSSFLLPASELELAASGLGLDDAKRSWSRCKDFSWPLAAASGKGGGISSPNWKRLPLAEREEPPRIDLEREKESVVAFETLFPLFLKQ